ncbi:aldehyde dehydrogenase family protein [Streptomyces sp. NPDC056697]|uniref:aldehyde dehydrogenase family protein n=1 Tax=Streptomyces sp. NPDC056697 TaxID=3345915 RepID=UPI0036A7A267
MSEPSQSRVRKPGLTAQQRRYRARLAAHASWANTSDRTARTAAGTAAFLERFERQVDPEGALPPRFASRWPYTPERLTCCNSRSVPLRRDNESGARDDRGVRGRKQDVRTRPDRGHGVFTGSTPAGWVIGEGCGGILCPVTLELGGKSAVIVWGSDVHRCWSKGHCLRAGLRSWLDGRVASLPDDSMSSLCPSSAPTAGHLEGG